MSIRLIAKELYRLHQAVEQLEKQIRNAPPENRPDLQEQLRKVRAERDRMKNALEGSKSDSKKYT